MEQKSEWKDPLKRLIEDHKQISEYVEDFEKILDFLHEEQTWPKVKSFKNFLEQYLADHFEFEEKRVFPAILAGIDTVESKKLISELQEEHRSIQNEAKQCCNTISEDTRLLDKETNEKINFLGRNIANSKLRHASKEDDKLVPIIEKNRHLFSRSD